MQSSIWQGGKLDATAQRQLFQQYGERLYRVAYRYLGDRMAAEDVTAEAMVKIFGGLPQARFEHLNQFEAWLRRIVINKALERLRQQKRWRRDQDLNLPDRECGESAVLNALSLQEVMGLIEQLPLGYRTVLQLSAFEGYTHAEIAKVLQISVGTSKSQLKKARAYLQARLDKLNAV